jgi:hypothetical protein
MEDKNTSIEFSDNVIRRFLLGSLSAPDQLAFEQRLFSDPRLDSRVRLAELDLADDYTYLRLSAGERGLFEEKFLVSEDRRRQVEVSLALRDRFASASVLKTKSTFIAQLRTLFRLRRPSWRLAFGLAILLVLFGATWLVIKEPRIVERVSNTINPRRPSPRSAPQEVHHPANTSSPEHQITPAPMPVHDQTSPASVSLALVPVASPGLGSMPLLALPKDEQAIVRLQLALTTNQPGTYRAELLTVDGQTIFSAKSIRTPENGSAQVDFDVPARLLTTGINYQVRLVRDNAGIKENLGRYYFRVP